jgi:hypothetical protein
MLPNNSRSTKKRLHQLITAIKLVFASTFKGEAKSLLDTTAHRIEEEKMAVIIQEIVGQSYDKKRFYPTFSGVLKSINYYPVSYMKRDEGVVYLALGFGRTIVDGEKCLRVSPKYPTILPQFFSIKATKQNSQNVFYGLSLKSSKNNSKDDLSSFSLKVAEEDGSLKWLGSVISNDDNTLRDSLATIGTRIVSFAPILKWNSIPLAEISNRMLTLGKAALGCPVEIEFAVTLKKNETPEFCLLQIKPMVLTGLKSIQFNPKNVDPICKSNITLGDGKIDQVYDIVVVRPETFDPAKTSEIAKEVEKINNQFGLKEKYILSGPGRWGSADPWLGIPVKWQQISQAKVIIEVGRTDMPVDPSFGSHFFQNITSLHVAYFTIDPKRIDILNLNWLPKENLVQSKTYVDWYRFEDPFLVTLDGTTGKGFIYKPEPEELEIMDEEESSGI